MKLFFITKKHLMMACAVVVVAAVMITGSVAVFASAEKKLPIYCVENDKKQIAISFDAAWGKDKKVQNLYYVNFSNL